ncbi:hypothetical protein H7F15_08250 [Pontibacter sp. Tf4]|uniref:hypothetical protein n=1 Tax=Pontibacter sp. Tf4 TaxID=2761620 RepID=UPI001624A40B|nr:hypothetical protein [Pontibacter sp. Tf4]MBB6611024.1 hypothetical protein [Pontibacter sp. Tf4]
MQNISFEFLQILLFILIVAGNILGYKIKAILRNKGYEVSYWIHRKDGSKFRELIKQEADPTLKSKYRLMYWSEIAVSIVFVAVFILMIYNLP